MSTKDFQEDLDESQTAIADLTTTTMEKLQQLQASLQNDAQKELSQLVKLGKNDDAQCVEKTKDLFEDVTCQDLTYLMECQSFKPQIFTSYIKLMKYLHEMRQDCEELQDQIFGSPQGEVNTSNEIPDWVKHLISRKNGGENENDSHWNKIMIMDPPTLQWIEEEQSQQQTLHPTDSEVIEVPVVVHDIKDGEDRSSQYVDPQNSNSRVFRQSHVEPDGVPAYMTNYQTSTVSENIPDLQQATELLLKNNDVFENLQRQSSGEKVEGSRFSRLTEWVAESLEKKIVFAIGTGVDTAENQETGTDEMIDT